MTRALAGLLLSLVAALAQADVLEVVYQDQDAGTPPYLSRYLITPDFVRIDQGRDEDAYLVLDRRKGVLFDVQPEQRQVLVIRSGKTAVKLPSGVRADIRQSPRPERGQSVVERTVEVGGQLCARIITAEGRQTEVAAALREFREVLAQTQWRTWQGTPRELRQNCELQLHVLQPGQEYGRGLPLSMSYFNGLQRNLQQVGQVPERPELFLVPLDYRLGELPH